MAAPVFVGALVAHHREPERAHRISRGWASRWPPTDVADEAVVGAPLIEMRRPAGQAVDRRVGVELFGRKTPPLLSGIWVTRLRTSASTVAPSAGVGP